MNISPNVDINNMNDMKYKYPEHISNIAKPETVQHFSSADVGTEKSETFFSPPPMFSNTPPPPDFTNPPHPAIHIPVSQNPPNYSSSLLHTGRIRKPSGVKHDKLNVGKEYVTDKSDYNQKEITSESSVSTIQILSANSNMTEAKSNKESSV